MHGPEPFQVAAAFRDRDHFAFLDSSRSDSGQGRYSILAWEPERVFRSKGRRISIRSGGTWTHSEDDPFAALARLTADWLPESGGNPFAGGAIGYFGYDLFRHLETTRAGGAVDDLDLPDCCLAVYKRILVFDHATGEWNAECPLLPDVRSMPAQTSRSIGPLESNMTRDAYIESVRRALDFIAAGDIYQVNLSLRFSREVEVSPFEIFARLRELNPSHYGSFLNCGDHAIVSASPELFLLRESDSIETRPIKGTRPRGRNAAEDETMKRELESSPKEAAELTMIVDLERNDLGRVCEYGSVRVVEHRHVQELPTLFHTVSTVRGKLPPRTPIVEILRATFPGGSISGCPKIRALEIIDELEPTRRHVYTGAIGFLGFNGDMRLSIAIRTLTSVGKRVHYQAGSGIVADSVPAQEYEETVHKALATENAIGAAAR